MGDRRYVGSRGCAIVNTKGARQRLDEARARVFAEIVLAGDAGIRTAEIHDEIGARVIRRDVESSLGHLANRCGVIVHGADRRWRLTDEGRATHERLMRDVAAKGRAA